MIALKAIIETTETTPHHELSWSHPNKLMRIEVFRSRRAARGYIKLQGWTACEAEVRMCKMRGHKWANAWGNVVVIRFGEKEPPGGWLYLFANGGRWGLWAHGLPED